MFNFDNYNNGTFLYMIGVVSIKPFVYVLSDSSKIQNNPFLKYAYDLGDFRNENQYIIF